MIYLTSYIQEAYSDFPPLATAGAPWEATAQIPWLIEQQQRLLGIDFVIEDKVAIHREAVIEKGAVLKGPLIISKGCLVAAHAYLRGGVFLAEGVTIGPGCEVKSSMVFRRSTLAHFNFVGDSLIGADVNMEAGSLLANHFNEREDKEIAVWLEGKAIRTGAQKFGALVGDGCRIGANAVTQPGTLLLPRSVVGRLTLVDQVGSS